MSTETQAVLDKPISDDDVVHLICDCQDIIDGLPALTMCGQKDEDPMFVELGEGIDCPLCWSAEACPGCGV